MKWFFIFLFLYQVPAFCITNVCKQLFPSAVEFQSAASTEMPSSLALAQRLAELTVRIETLPETVSATERARLESKLNDELKNLSSMDDGLALKQYLAALKQLRNPSPVLERMEPQEQPQTKKSRRTIRQRLVPERGYLDLPLAPEESIISAIISSEDGFVTKGELDLFSREEKLSNPIRFGVLKRWIWNERTGQYESKIIFNFGYAVSGVYQVNKNEVMVVDYSLNVRFYRIQGESVEEIVEHSKHLPKLKAPDDSIHMPTSLVLENGNLIIVASAGKLLHLERKADGFHFKDFIKTSSIGISSLKLLDDGSFLVRSTVGRESIWKLQDGSLRYLSNIERNFRWTSSTTMLSNQVQAAVVNRNQIHFFKNDIEIPHSRIDLGQVEVRRLVELSDGSLVAVTDVLVGPRASKIFFFGNDDEGNRNQKEFAYSKTGQSKFFVDSAGNIIEQNDGRLRAWIMDKFVIVEDDNAGSK